MGNFLKMEKIFQHSFYIWVQNLQVKNFSWKFIIFSSQMTRIIFLQVIIFCLAVLVLTESQEKLVKKLEKPAKHLKRQSKIEEKSLTPKDPVNPETAAMREQYSKRMKRRQPFSGIRSFFVEENTQIKKATPANPVSLLTKKTAWISV